MGWGIFNKLKQGIAKIADFGKKALKTVIDKAPAIINAGQKVLNSGVADGVLGKLNIDKNKLMGGLNTANNAVNFAGKSWAPKLVN